MKHTRTRQPRRLSLTILVVALAGSLIAPAFASAPPPGKGKPNKGKRTRSVVKAKRTKPGGPYKVRVQPTRIVKPRGPSRPAVVRSYVKPGRHNGHTKRFWHPLHNTKPRTSLWLALGYSYHPDGRPYVAAPRRPGVSVNVRIGDGPHTGRHGDELFTQMQELTQLVYEWRTFNESPALHACVERHSDRSTVVEIRATNEQFDLHVRTAMRKLCAGQPVQANLALARGALDDLFLCAERFEPAASRGVQIEVNVGRY